jgi:hypothetical protein
MTLFTAMTEGLAGLDADGFTSRVDRREFAVHSQERIYGFREHFAKAGTA